MVKRGRKARRSKRKMTYHKRSGHPVIHKAKTGRKYIMVRKKKGGVKRLYIGSKKFKREVTVH